MNAGMTKSAMVAPLVPTAVPTAVLTFVRISVRSFVFPALLGCSLLGCGTGGNDSALPVERISARPWQENLELDGVIKAAASTSLAVPGGNWEGRTLIEMVAEGSAVKKGQVVARFDAQQARVELSQAETELLRKLISEQRLVADAAVNLAELQSDRAKVGADLQLSQQYAQLDLSVFERNKILDTLVDIGYLQHKSQYLGWKTGHLTARSGAAQALLQSQKETVQLSAKQKRSSLAGLELVAPHDGVFLLKRSWDGSVPTIGSTRWAGQEFATLPDVNQLIASFSVAEGVAFGLKPGLAIQARLQGSGAVLNLTVAKVGKSSSTRSRESPVKYSDFEAAITPADAVRLGLRPGQGISGKVQLVNQPTSLTVPNLALIQEGKQFFVLLEQGKNVQRQAVELGLRGPVRSEIKSGLVAGNVIRLVPETKEATDPAKDSVKQGKS